MNICSEQKERAELRIPASQRVNNVKRRRAQSVPVNTLKEAVAEKERRMTSNKVQSGEMSWNSL